MFMRWLVVASPQMEVSDSFASVIVCSVVEVNDSDIVLITSSVISVSFIKLESVANK